MKILRFNAEENARKLSDKEFKPMASGDVLIVQLRQSELESRQADTEKMVLDLKEDVKELRSLSVSKDAWIIGLAGIAITLLVALIAVQASKSQKRKKR